MDQVPVHEGEVQFPYLAAERSFLHLLESEGEGAIGASAANELICQVEGRGAGCAVVVDVVDGDARHPGLVKGSLAAGRVTCRIHHINNFKSQETRRKGSLTVNIPDCGLFDLIVCDPGVGERLRHSLLRDLWVVEIVTPSRFLNLGR